MRRRRIAKAPPPWTEDPIIANYRFCNVRREDDAVTVWVRRNIREPFADHPDLWLMLCIARQVNWPDTLAELIAEGAWPKDGFDAGKLEEAIGARIARGEKTWTGAYVIAAGSTPGVPKHRHIVRNVLAPLWGARDEFRGILASRDKYLQAVHRLLTRHDGWGPFMAYQAVVDMRFTKLLDDAVDIRQWAAAGPGTLRGLNRLRGRATDARISQAQALSEIREIDGFVREATGVDMDFSDIPNILCETDKYIRVAKREGEPRAKYVAREGASVPGVDDVESAAAPHSDPVAKRDPYDAVFSTYFR
ncbi:MAG: hypothetical protein ING19_08890 [Azospirillum sp.]|nr:hypothetical protein [Azospirillum sp.]